MNNKTVKRTRILIVICFILSGLTLHAQELFFKNYYKPGTQDATLAVLEMLKDASRLDNPKIIFDEGVYHFYPEKAFEKYGYVTNHDNSLRRIAFPIIGYNNLEIVGNETAFIFHGLMVPFHVEDSKNIKISNISIDWEIPLHSEAKIVANDPSKGTFDIEISSQFPYAIKNNNLYFIKEGFEHDLDRAILFDPKRKAVAYRNNDFMPLDMNSNVEVRNNEQLKFPNYIDVRSPQFTQLKEEYTIKAEELMHGLVRITTSRKVPPVGMIMVSKGKMGQNRLANAIHLLKSEDIVLDRVAIHHAGGMGVVAERCVNVTITSMKVQASGNRMVSTTADATHFSGCKGKIILKDCIFKQMLDDATNVHSAYVIVEDVLDDHRLGVRVGHHHQAGFIFAGPGDEIGFINQNLSTNSIYKGKVKTLEMVNGRYYIITFEDKIPLDVNKDFVLENLDWYPEVEISGCRIDINRARGILLSTPKRTIVENNYFSNMMSAILVPVELSWWYESGQAQELIIRNNEFGDCCFAGNKHPVINIISTIGGDKEDYSFGKIIIDSNKFKHFDSWILHANSVKELEFTNNIIENSGSFEPIYPEMPVLDFEHIGKLKVNNNTYKGNLKSKTIIKEVKDKEVKF